MSANIVFSIEKLNGRDNYATWKFAVQAYMEHENLWSCITGENVDSGKDLKAKSKLILLVDAINYVHIQDAKTSKEVWFNLKRAFDDNGLTRKVALLKDLITTTLESSRSVEDYVNKIMTSAHKLRNIGFSGDDEWLGTLMLAGLPDQYKPMIMDIESSGMKISTDSIKTKLLQEVSSESEATAFCSFKKKPQEEQYYGISPSCFNCNRYGHLSEYCRAQKKTSGAGSNNGSTILDYLNKDCWRAVLAYVPVQDIVRSEHTSRRWQEIVLVYLQSVRFSIVHPDCSDNETHRIGCSLLLRSTNYSSFESWTKKLGASVVAVYCESEDSLKIIDNCPKLEVVTFIRLTNNTLLKASQTGNLKHIRWVIFISCPVSDHCISQFLANNALQQLEINDNVNGTVTGQCLISIHSKTLKTLVLKDCNALEGRHLLSAAEHLSELTKLLLLKVPEHIYNNVHLLLDKMPKLECLYNVVGKLHGFEKKGGSIYTRVSRLSRLKYLYLDIQTATDQDLELVTRHCQELRVLWLEPCTDVTRRGVAAVCNNVGERLIALRLRLCRHLTDDDVMLIVRSCPNLKRLDLSRYSSPSVQLPALVAAERRKLGRSALLLREGCYSQYTPADQDYAQELRKRYPELELHYHNFGGCDRNDKFWHL